MIKLFTNKWEIKNINGIIFDKDGTIIDSHVYWGKIIEERSRAIVEKYNLKSEFFDKICFSMGYSRSKKKLLSQGPVALLSREEVINAASGFLFSKGINLKNEDLENIFRKVHEAFLKKHHNYIKLLPGVLDFLELLRKEKIKVALVTSDSYENTVKIFKFLKILKYFDAVIGRETVNKPKVSGKPALKALELLNINKNSCVCIGDAPQDIIMANNSGINRCIAVATGQIGIKELKKQTPYALKTLKLLSVTKE